MRSSRFNTETQRHGDDTEKNAGATAPRSGALTATVPTKTHAQDRDGLYFRRRCRRQHAAGYAGRGRVAPPRVLRGFVSPCLHFSAASVASVAGAL